MDYRYIEAEIVLPKKDKRRLWYGILESKGVVLNFNLLHLKEEREVFEPVATKIIASLQFPSELAGVLTSDEGLPLPPDYSPIPPQDFIDDIPHPENWRAYDGRGSINALQAFYWRELPHYGWRIAEYVPYPGSSNLGFARFLLEKDGRKVTLGILPYRDEPGVPVSLGRLAFKPA